MQFYTFFIVVIFSFQENKILKEFTNTRPIVILIPAEEQDYKNFAYRENQILRTINIAALDKETSEITTYYTKIEKL